MRVLISGGSGFVGGALTRHLRSSGHDVAHLTRPGTRLAPGDVRWDPSSATIDIAAMEGFEAVVHLSGASVADGRWTDKRKAILRSSRLDSTRLLVDAIARLRLAPRVFVCASAVGYYGDRGEEILTESSAPGADFLALLARDWEAEAMRAARNGTRTVLLRFGVILAAHGGALPKMIAPLRWGVGGRLGTGRQWIAWVALEDAVEIAREAIVDDRFSGPVNVVAPNPVRNAEFTELAARVLHRPAALPAPAFALRLALGEMAEMLLSSQRVRSERLLELGYRFRHERIEPFLEAALAQ